MKPIKTLKDLSCVYEKMLIFNYLQQTIDLEQMVLAIQVVRLHQPAKGHLLLKHRV